LPNWPSDAIRNGDVRRPAKTVSAGNWDGSGKGNQRFQPGDGSVNVFVFGLLRISLPDGSNCRIGSTVESAQELAPQRSNTQMFLSHRR
jgi:hypothetical protein